VTQEINQNVEDRFAKMMMFLNSSESATKDNFNVLSESFNQIIKRSIVKKKTDKNFLIANIRDDIASVKKQI